MNLQNVLEEEVLKAKQQMKYEEKVIFVRKRRECNARAQKIVEQLLDTTTAEKFLDVAKYINQAHLDDVFEERFILCTCGYPLCDKKLEKIPKQRYKISTTANKVYDITERKKFCSSQCFSAAKFIRNQLPTSPLWVLEDESCRKYRLWSNKKSTFVEGDEVDLKYQEVKKTEIDKSQKVSTRDIPPRESTSENKSKKLDTGPDIKDVAAESAANTEIITNTLPLDKLKNLSVGIQDIRLQSERDEEIHTTCSENKKEIELAQAIADGTNIKPNKMKTKELDSKNIHKEKSINKLKTCDKKQYNISILKMIEEALQSWITMSSLAYLFGEEQVKMNCIEKGHNLDIHNSQQLTSKQMEQYAKMCKKLDLMEIQDKQKEQCDILKPLPDYETLKQENHKLMVKVRAYFQGNTHIPTAELNGGNESQQIEQDSEQNTFLPLIDSHNQKAMRRNIVLSFLDPIISKFLLDCNINEKVSSELRQLVDTFELDAKNITFKPALQKLIALFILKLLTMVQDKSFVKINNFFSSKVFTQTLSAYSVSEKEFDTLITTVTSVEAVISAKKNQA